MHMVSSNNMASHSWVYTEWGSARAPAYEVHPCITTAGQQIGGSLLGQGLRGVDKGILKASDRSASDRRGQFSQHMARARQLLSMYRCVGQRNSTWGLHVMHGTRCIKVHVTLFRARQLLST
jgi:hypothetical protein